MNRLEPASSKIGRTKGDIGVDGMARGSLG
jgi:hypothetical protein